MDRQGVRLQPERRGDVAGERGKGNMQSKNCNCWVDLHHWAVLNENIAMWRGIAVTCKQEFRQALVDRVLADGKAVAQFIRPPLGCWDHIKSHRLTQPTLLYKLLFSQVWCNLMINPPQTYWFIIFSHGNIASSLHLQCHISSETSIPQHSSLL